MVTHSRLLYYYKRIDQRNLLDVNSYFKIPIALKSVEDCRQSKKNVLPYIFTPS